MTYEEAYKILRQIVFESDNESLALMEALDALEKQIPKRPIFEDLGQGVRCPTCDDSFSCCFISKDEGCIIFDYCQKCGQRLDWSKK